MKRIAVRARSACPRLTFRESAVIAFWAGVVHNADADDLDEASDDVYTFAKAIDDAQELAEECCKAWKHDMAVKWGCEEACRRCGLGALSPGQPVTPPGSQAAQLETLEKQVKTLRSDVKNFYRLAKDCDRINQAIESKEHPEVKHSPNCTCGCKHRHLDPDKASQSADSDSSSSDGKVPCCPHCGNVCF